MNTGDVFTPEQVERARRYHGPLYLLLAVDLVLDLAVLTLLAFGPPGDRLGRGLNGLPFWAEALAWPAAVVTLMWLIGLPLSYWRGYVHEKQWGFSTQSRMGWLVDRLKGLGVGVILTSGVLAGFLAVARALPETWPVVAAVGGGVVVLFLSFIAPVVLEPVFNKFEPLGDRSMAAEIRSLAERAGVPIRDVLVADASRRTRKENAYVSGLGKTRRVVVYDTLLSRAQPAEVRVVAAHELAHRRLRHVTLTTVIGMAGAIGVVMLLWVLLGVPSILRATGAGPGDPRVIPFVLLVAGAFQTVVMPAASALSRRWERAADRSSLEWTGDLEAYQESFRALAISNLLDLDPPRAVYVMTFTHPTPPQRIAAGRRWAEKLGAPTSTLPPTTAR